MTPADLILTRLQGVREVGPQRWAARCPAHEDRSPSLSIRTTDDGNTLIHCHAGCAPDDILSAIGLTWKDLYPQRDKAALEAALAAGHRHRQRTLADITLQEWAGWVIAIAAAELRAGKQHPLEDRAVLAWAMDIAGGCQHG
ncbi:MAG: hypothetical protein KAX46_14515 [Chromatiaceae bacterium]|nr:hypothetical protein [Chromatiaceae bacterium]